YCHYRYLHSFPTRRSSDLSLGSFIGMEISRFIFGCSLERATDALSDLTPRHRYRLKKTSDVERANDVYKQIARALVFRTPQIQRSEEHTSELQSRSDLVCR